MGLDITCDTQDANVDDTRLWIATVLFVFIIFSLSCSIKGIISKRKSRVVPFIVLSVTFIIVDCIYLLNTPFKELVNDFVLDIFAAVIAVAIFLYVASTESKNRG